MGDYRVTSGESLPLPKTESRKVWRRRLLILILVLVAIAAAGVYIRVPRYIVTTGYITTEEYAEVRPATTGVVSEILISSGRRVEKGDILVKLDDTEDRASFEEAQAQFNKAEAELTRREAEIQEQRRMIKEQIEIAKLRLQNASTKYLRAQELLGKGLIAASALEDEKLNEELARAELTSLLSKDQSIYDKELAVMRQERAARQEAITRAASRLRGREIRAPISGMVLRYEFVIGELVRPETVLLEIFGGSEQVLKVRIAERHATRVAPGQPYKARLTSYRSGFQSIWFEGTVAHLRNVIQTEGVTTYRVAYCTFDAGRFDVPPGTSAEARIYYGDSNLWKFALGLR
jgi:multidrug resistance efflux pump